MMRHPLITTLTCLISTTALCAEPISITPMHDADIRLECLYWTYTQAGNAFCLKTAEWKRSPGVFLQGYPQGKRYTAGPAYSPGVRFTEEIRAFCSPFFLDVQATYVPFKDQKCVKKTFLASLTLPKTVAGGFPSEKIRSIRSLQYFLSDFLVRYKQNLTCNADCGLYAGVRCLALIQKHRFLHTHMYQKGQSKVEWNLKMGNVGAAWGLQGKYCANARFILRAQLGASALKGLRGGGCLSWNLHTHLTPSDDRAHYTPNRQWTFGWNASLQAEGYVLRNCPNLRLILGYDIQQWFKVLQRDTYDFVSWHCHQKRSPLTLHGASLGLLFCY